MQPALRTNHKTNPLFPRTKEESDRKRQAYKWLDPGKRGTFKWIPIDKLQVDHTYQRTRKAEEAVLGRMAREWSWPLCEALIVARRPDGSYFVVNGQGRVIGAKRRGDIPELPCMVFEIEGPEAEAAIFAEASRSPRRLQSTDGFRADLRAGNPVAIAIDKMVRAAGYEVLYDSTTTKRRSIRCVGALRRAYNSNPAACERSFLLCVAIAQGRLVRDALLQGIFYIESALEAAHSNKSLLHRDYHDKLLAIGEDKLWEAIQESARYWKKGGAKVYASGILKMLNKGRREEAKLRLGVDAS
jgi:hypothetical protein